ncbi:MAG: PAS domain-containing protein [Gammaproteobacteria bacterium]
MSSGRSRAAGQVRTDGLTAAFAHAMLDASGALTWATDAAGAVVYTNAAWREFTGDTGHAAFGRGWLDFVHEAERTAAGACVGRALAGSGHFDTELRLRRAGGDHLWVKLVARPHSGRNGELLGLVLSAMDVDEQKRAELSARALKSKLEFAIDGSQAGLWDWPDVSRDEVWWSPRHFELLGYADGEIANTYSSFLAHVHPADRPRLEAELARCCEHGGLFELDYRLRHKRGEYRWVRSRAIARPDARSGAMHMAGSLQDIDAQKRAELHAAELQDKYEAAVEASTHGLWDWDIPGRYVWCSPSFKRLLGYAGTHEMRTDPGLVEDIVHPEDLAFVRSALEQHLGSGMPLDVEYRGHHRSGQYRWYRSRGQAAFDDDGRAVRVSGSTIDINLRKQAELALYDEKEKAQVTLASIGEAVVTTDAEGRIEFLNPVAESLLGVGLDRAWHAPVDELFTLVDEGSRAAIESPVRYCIEHVETVTSSDSALLLSRSGAEYAVEYSVSPIRREGARLHGVVLVFKDVTAERNMAREISYQATHDALTGLINRREFEQRLARVIATTRDEPSRHALCYLDLDQFKVVNDTCGHVAGDELLRQVSALLVSHTRKRDTVARLGGDEFGLLMEHCDVEQARRIGEVLREALANHRFSWEERSYSVGVSIGLVPIDEDSESVQHVLRQADAACYAAKDGGRNRLHVYVPTDQDLQRRHGEMAWVSRLETALETDAFELYFQRVRPAVAGSGGYVEILLRYPENGACHLPASFLPAAQRFGLSPRIDRWVVAALAQWYRDDPARWDSGDTFAVNLSGLSLSADGFLDFVVDCVRSSGMPTGQLCFEITETAAIENLSAANRFFAELRALGCRFALDDFGSGLSSFGYLRGLPVDFLKIDGSFVRDCAGDDIALAMVRSIHDIGRVMGKLTIAEFAESDAVVARLGEVGVNYLQGYAVHRPAPLDEYHPAHDDA